MGRDSIRTPVPTGRRAERNRRAIVAAAREIFVRDGYDAGMNLIAASAGVSKMTVYNHFGSKEELFTEVIGEAMGEAHTTMAGVRAGLADAEDVRAALLHTARALVAASTDPSRMALRNLVTGELRRFPELGTAYLERGPAQSAAAMGELLGDLCDRGLLSIPDLELAVVQFFGLTIYPHLITGSIGAALPQDLADRLVSDGVDTFLSRYGRREEG